MEKNYRYPGTCPFQEKDSHLFFGRTSDKVKLTELIELEKLVVLFGKSGYGKSSLLNAAVIPRLRRFAKQNVYNVRLKEASGFGKHILEYDPLCSGAMDYRRVAKEIIRVYQDEQKEGRQYLSRSL